ncbi:MAG: glycosyltransferase family 39 protein, partial [Anaerolineae bacterium]
MGSYRSQIRGWEVVALIAVLVAAIAFRAWHLNRVPPGLTHDEASNGHDAAAILRGVRPIYFTVGYGHEPLYPYSVALLMALLGTTDLTLRLTTVVWGSALILLSYLLARRLLGALPALITAAWMAVSFWCVMTSRVGLRAVASATTFTASTYAFWRANPLPSAAGRGQRAELGSRLIGGSWPWWFVSGVFLGASIYTYMASRAMPAVYVLFLAYLGALHVFGRQQESETRSVLSEREMAWGTNLRSEWRRQLIGVVVLLVIASILVVPLIHYLSTYPEAEQRLEQLSGPIKDALRGRFGDLWRRVSRSLPMFTVRGDPLWLYNIPGRPLLDVAGGAFFYAGLLVCLWRWRDPRYVFLLLWLVVGVAPALVTGPDATALRSIAAQPTIFVIAGLGLTTVARFLYRRCGRGGRVATATAVTALLLVTGVRTVHAYFGVWAQHRNVRVAYHHALVEQAHYLDAQTEGGTVALSSIYPGRFHDPYAMEVTLHRDDLSLRWFDGRYSLVFPAGGESRVVIPTIAPLDAALLPLFMPQASLVHTERLRPDDLIT